MHSGTDLAEEALRFLADGAELAWIGIGAASRRCSSSAVSQKFASKKTRRKRRFFANHPQTEERLGPRALRMTSPILSRTCETGYQEMLYGKATCRLRRIAAASMGSHAIPAFALGDVQGGVCVGNELGT